MPGTKTPKKNAAVTGASGAIGQAIAAGLAEQNYRVFLLVRNSSKAAQSIASIRNLTGSTDLEFRLVDLSSQSSVQSLAASWNNPLHVLVNNAAISPLTRQESASGIELQFATNVLSYFWTIKYFEYKKEVTCPFASNQQASQELFEICQTYSS
jgi:NAD(P)-dependent dehydrogenase (short-subunit alcohol dehydrogenase family)